MIASSLARLCIIGFFLPVYDCLVPMSKKEQDNFLEEYFVEIEKPFLLNSFYKLSSLEFDHLVQKIGKRDSSLQFLPGSILLNVLQHLAKAGVCVDIGTSHGKEKSYSKLENLYKDLFRNQIIDLSFVPPPRLMCLYEKNDHHPTYLLTTNHTGGLSDHFPEKLPCLADYNLVLMDGHILPYSSSKDIVKRAYSVGASVAVNCGKTDFLKSHKKEYLDILPMVSMFACNLEEAQILTGHEDIKDCALFLQGIMMPEGRVLVTNEANDFCISHNEKTFIYSPPHALKGNIVHPMGCGDAAAAGFFLGNLLQLPDSIQASLLAEMGSAVLYSFTTLIASETIQDILIKYDILPEKEN